MKNKKVIIIGAIAALAIIIGLIIFGIIYRYKLLHENNIGKTQVVGKLKISDGFIINDDGIYTYTVNVTNPTKKSIKVDYLLFTFYDKDNEKMTKLLGPVDRTIKSDETIQVSSSVDRDLTKANRVKIEVKK